MAWEIDAAHSQAEFSVRHMMVTTVRGRFTVLRGKLELDEAHPENSLVEAEVDAASINTHDEKRDGHLRSPDFFDVEKYPIITFKSTNVESAGDNDYRVRGNLTIHGITKEATFKAEYSGQLKDPYGLQRAGLSAKTKINRKDFGLNWNQALEAGGWLVSDDVTIEIDLSVVQKSNVQTNHPEE